MVMKKAIALFVLFTTLVFSQTSFVYENDHMVMKDNVTGQAISENYNSFYITFTMNDNDINTGGFSFSTGAYIKLYKLYANDGVSNWHWNAIDNNNLRCNIHLNTALEESSNIVYLRIQFNDYSFYYKLKRVG